MNMYWASTLDQALSWEYYCAFSFGLYPIYKVNTLMSVLRMMNQWHREVR